MKIDKNVPIPETQYRGQKESKYPFDKLGIGDSFFIECNKENARAKQSTLCALASRFGKNKRKSFIVKQVLGGVRVWRIPKRK